MSFGKPCYAFVTPTPVGVLGAVCSDGALSSIDFLDAATSALDPATPVARRVFAQLQRYFDRPEAVFDIPLALVGTPFQQRVWQLMLRIPVGDVMTYGEVARRLNSAPRAVGGACRANPIPVIVPCHRIVGQQGLVGYAGDTRGAGIAVKRWLLQHEGYLCLEGCVTT
jgi:methylated-DNA-[protein]-cysteine S-methyltransferase